MSCDTPKFAWACGIQLSPSARHLPGRLSFELNLLIYSKTIKPPVFCFSPAISEQQNMYQGYAGKENLFRRLQQQNCHSLNSACLGKLLTIPVVRFPRHSLAFLPSCGSQQDSKVLSKIFPKARLDTFFKIQNNIREHLASTEAYLCTFTEEEHINKQDIWTGKTIP